MGGPPEEFEPEDGPLEGVGVGEFMSGESFGYPGLFIGRGLRTKGDGEGVEGVRRLGYVSGIPDGNTRAMQTEREGSD